MRIIITDTNVFFDIIGINALPEFFALPYEICTTDFVLSEILRSHQKEQMKMFILEEKLTIFTLTDYEIEDVKAFLTNRSFKGITDKTVLWKAKQLSSILLTGDGKLRKEAIEQGVEVHGSIWVVENLLERHLIEKATAVILLKKLKEINSNLPMDDINKLIKRILNESKHF